MDNISQQEDAEQFACWMNDVALMELAAGNAHKNVTMEGERKWLANAVDSKDPHFAIVSLEGNRLLGTCDLVTNLVNRTATLGIFLGEKESFGRGYGTEAVRLLVGYGFDQLGLHNIELGVYAFNARAIVCYKKVGFREYGRRHQCCYLRGEWHDELRMELLPTDWYGHK